jgi:alpha-glucoside transport system substrate-binding protein
MTLYVVASWGGDEQRAFEAMVRPWEQSTGNRVAYEGTRDLDQVLRSRVANGDPPDLAAVSGPIQLAQFARSGKLLSLDHVLSRPTLQSEYATSWLDLSSVNGHLYAVVIKANLRNVIWYDPSVLQATGVPFSLGSPPTTWTALAALTDQLNSAGGTRTPWCLGLESGVSSGSPGTEWIQDFLLRGAGPRAYADWVLGKLRWTDPRVMQAWQRFGAIVAQAYGGKDGVLATNFLKAGDPLFTTPPGCYLFHQAPSFTTAFLEDTPSAQPGSDFNFFDFPSIDPRYAAAEQVTGDLVSVFKDSPAARSLIAYLATAPAQAIWVRHGGALSANRLVPLTDYPDQLSQGAARILTAAQAVVFDAAVVLPPAVEAAFSKGVLDYVGNRASLPAILARLPAIGSSG